MIKNNKTRMAIWLKRLPLNGLQIVRPLDCPWCCSGAVKDQVCSICGARIVREDENSATFSR